MFSQPGRQAATICATLGINFHGCAENYTEQSTHCALKARSSLIFVPVGFGSMWSKKLKRPNWLVILNSKCDIKFSLWLHPLVLKVFFFRFVILLSRCLLSMKFYISGVLFCVEKNFFCRICRLTSCLNLLVNRKRKMFLELLEWSSFWHKTYVSSATLIFLQFK